MGPLNERYAITKKQIALHRWLTVTTAQLPDIHEDKKTGSVIYEYALSCQCKFIFNQFSLLKRYCQQKHIAIRSLWR